MARIFVTVGMSDWRFDRLVDAAERLADQHDVFIQRGPARPTQRCPSTDFLDPSGVERLVRESDVTITHAGNTLRLVQRWRRVPIAVARRADLNEAANDHQVEFLRHEQCHSPVVAVWDVADLRGVVARYPEESRTVGSRPVVQASPPEQVRATMEELCSELLTRRRWRRLRQ